MPQKKQESLRGDFDFVRFLQGGLGKVSQLYIPNSARRPRIAHRLKIAYFHKGKAEEILLCSGFEAFWANISFLWNIAICSSYHLEQVDQSRPLEQYTYPNDHLQNRAI